MQGGGVFDTARQIVEFEELVSRLDRINDVVIRRPSTTSTSTSVPSPSPPARVETSHLAAASSLPYDPPVSGRSPVDDEQQRVRVHIGIDEDLRMILEMDPSIVDGTLAPVAPDSRSVPNVARSLRATRLQGWYCTERELTSLVSDVICAHSIQLYLFVVNFNPFRRHLDCPILPLVRDFKFRHLLRAYINIF